MSPMNIAIIGCGAAARRYYVPAFEAHPDENRHLHLVDKNIEQARQLAPLLGAAHVAADYTEVIDRVQGAIILLPHFLHHPVAMDFLKRGIPVLCEKPLAESPREVSEMNQTARQTGAALCVNNTRRMFPAFQAIQKIIASGEIGKITAIDYVEGSVFDWPSATGFYVDPAVTSKGLLLDLGSHALDLICWWLGKKPRIISYQDDSFGGPESVLRLEGEADGCRVRLFLNRLSDLKSTIRIQGHKGAIEGENFGWRSLRLHSPGGAVRKRTFPTPARNYPDFVKPVLANFLRVVQGKEPPLVSGEDVLASVELMDECYRRRTRFEMPWNRSIEVKTPVAPGLTLVTGATGFIGGRIVELLHLTGERKVRATIRQWSSAARLGRLPVEIKPMDLMNPAQIEQALEGVTDVIHCAKGLTGATVQGTEHLLAAALKQGVRRFVHLSTAEVYGDVTGTISEERPWAYTGNNYNQTKIDAEKRCWEYHAKGLPVVVVRPAIVYGPFSYNWSVRVARMLLARSIGTRKAFQESKCNLVYVDDLARAILTALESETAPGQAFNINGPEVVTWQAYFQTFNDLLDLPPLVPAAGVRADVRRALMTPVRMVGGVVRDHFMGPVKKVAETFSPAKVLMKKIEQAIKVTPDGEDYTLYSRNAVYAADKARTLLGFEPRISVRDGLQRTVAWLRHQGIVPSP